MADDKAKKALREAQEAITAVHEGRVDQPGTLKFEGVRAYWVTSSEVRKIALEAAPIRKPSVAG